MESKAIRGKKVRKRGHASRRSKARRGIWLRERKKRATSRLLIRRGKSFSYTAHSLIVQGETAKA